MKLGDAAQVTMGRQRAPQYASGEHLVLYLRAANVKEGRLELSDTKRMNFKPEEQRTYELRSGDVLVTEGCGSLGQLGASAQWNGDLPGTVCFQNTLLRLRAKEGVTLPGFLDAWASFAFVSGLFASVASGTNIFHIGATRAAELPIGVPPIGEQRRIIDLMSTVTRLGEDVAAVVHTSESVLAQATESVFSDLTRRVEHRPISQIIRRERRPITVDPSLSYRQIGIRSHRKGIFHKEQVFGAELGSKRIFWIEPGDLVFNIVFAWEGAIAVAGESERGMCGSHRFPTYRASIDGVAEYLRHFFRSKLGQRMLNEASPGSAGRNRTLNQSLLLSNNVPVPPATDLRAAVSLLDAAEETVSNARAYQAAVTNVRRALVTDLLSGEYEIPESYDALLDAV